jgi:two-component system CheB/CheR fusion protein
MHLDSRQTSHLAEVLGRETAIPVRQVTKRIKIVKDNVYLIAPTVDLTLQNGEIVPVVRESSSRLHAPVDLFFQSLAETRHNQAIGVILSGNASDGALGLKAIKAAGGVTFAQDPETAKYDGMPRSAISTGSVDFVLPPKKIGLELARIGKHPYVAPVSGSQAADPLPDNTDSLSKIFSMILASSGVDFTYYKSTTVKRRILRRMMLHRIEKVPQYLAYLRTNPIEISALFDDILINVTEFFRDPEAFRALHETVFPALLSEAHTGDPLRIWVPGCATGEEAYSIAIAALEYLEERKLDTLVQVFATDVSETALDRARIGIYPEGVIRAIPPERLRRYFVRLDTGYQINKRVREVCVFARQNLAKDPPFSKLDLISCRNVLIYLGPVLQKRVIPVFHYALRPNGFLLLGSSETIGMFAELFSIVDKKHKIYVRKPARQPVPLDFAVENRVSERAEHQQRAHGSGELDLQKEADRVLLARYAPPGVVTDGSLNILQFRGSTSPFLEPSAGIASLNLLRMAREGLLVELRNAFQKSRKQNISVRREGVRLRMDGHVRQVNFEIIPLKRHASREGRYLILFEDAPRTSSRLQDSGAMLQLSSKDSKPPSGEVERENLQLRQDLDATKEYLQSIIEEQEASNEELRSANEEVQSSNEELQSTNEELETAKEELQSTNEELNTVNEELQNRNLQLAQTGNDLLNLLSNVSIPIVMLGNDLRIRRFTPISEKVLNLIPSDVGRPISDIKFNIDIPNLKQLLLDVLENLGPKVLEVKDTDGRHYSLRIRPYRTEDNKIDGVVVVLVDLDPGRYGGDETTFERHDYSSSAMQLVGLDENLKAAREQLRVYASSLVSAQEEERRRVSRELHDELNQRMAYLAIELDRVQQSETGLTESGRKRLQTLKSATDSLSDEIRKIAFNLHPSSLEDLGLIPALQGYVRDLQEREGLEVKFTHEKIPKSVPDDIGLSLYRVVQEALRNVIKHAGSKRAQIALQGLAGSIHLAIRDNGKGFDPDSIRPGLGLVSMEERVRLCSGTFRVKTSPGRGTQIDIQVPLPPAPPAKKKKQD